MPRIKLKRRRSRRGPKRILPRAWRKHNRRRKRSSIEIIVAAWLKEDGIEFKQEKAIGQCHVDVFIAPRTIVELNGCFWHGHETCYPEPSRKFDLIRRKDSRRYAFFRNRGFDVIVLWECEILKEPERVRAVLRALGKK